MSLNQPKYDVVIIGAGIVGAACARSLSSEGMRVAVIERGVLAGGATAAGMGHIVVMDDSPAQLALTGYSQILWNDLRTSLPTNVEYELTGTLWVAADEEEMVEIRRKLELYESVGVRAEILDSETLAETEPNLRIPLAGALRVVADGVLYPPSAAQFLLASACLQGCELLAGRAVESAGCGEVKLEDGTYLQTPRIVNATGADASALVPGLRIKKRKGHLIITDRYPGFLHHQIVELGYLKSAHSEISNSVAFNVQPRKTGQILIGSSRQYEDESSGVNREILTMMIERALLYMPALSTLSAIRVWTGFRAATPDKLPLIGRTQDDCSMFIAAGHEGLGIATSLATAQLLTDEILERESAIPRDPYLPSRFPCEIACV